MNTDELRAEVEHQLEQAIAIDWSNPKNLSPLGIALTFQMAATKLLMQNAQRKWLKMWGVG
jgi:hypothetical protein